MLMIFFQVRTVSMNGCFHSGFCTLLARLTWHYVHTGIFLIEIPSNSESVQKGTCLLGIMSTLDFVYLDSVHVEVCPFENLSTMVSVHDWFCPIWFLLTSGSVLLVICPTGTLSTLILSTRKSVHMTNF